MNKFPISKRQIKLAEQKADLPTPGDVLYLPPNPDNTRKKCSKCIMRVKEGKCIIHDENIKIGPNSVCGYFIYGKPRQEWEDIEDLQAVSPELSGLITTENGTSCDICKWFQDGKCLAVIDENGDKAEVEGLGCCSRWKNY